jgi:ketosteroid isomerase-like protein
MASAKLELVRSILAEWQRGEYRSIEWAHPDIEFVLADLPDAAKWRGVSGMAEAWRQFLGAWQGHHVEVDDLLELDSERVLSLGRVAGRGRTSGLDLEPMQTEGANLFHVRAGKVTRLVVYFDRDHALADAGLAPEGRE